MDPGISRGVHAYAAALSGLDGITECVPGYASLLLVFDPRTHSADAVRERVYALSVKETTTTNGVAHRIPVVYGDTFGPDLEAVAQHCGRSAREVIDLHQSVDYLVYLLGFRPGFAFMGQTPAEIAVDRQSTPRTAVAPGSVGLAGRQTGIYPDGSPGGWQLIGRTPCSLIDEHGAPRFRAGDRVAFYAIPAGSFAEYQNASPWPER